MSAVDVEHNEEKYLVIGGAGFLGSHIVEALLARKEPNVAVYDLNNPPEGDVLEGVTYFLGDILDESNFLDVLQKVRTFSTSVWSAALITPSVPSPPYSTSYPPSTGSSANYTTASTSRAPNPS